MGLKCENVFIKGESIDQNNPVAMVEEDDAGRAEIPPMLTPEQRDALTYTPHCRQRWGERQSEGAASLLAPEDVQEFLTEFAWLKETEVALQCLFDGEFDLPKAVKLLHESRRQRHKTQSDRDERLQSEDFKTAVETHGKKFHLVQQALGQKVITREVVSKYYLWKRTTEFKEWRQRQSAKKTKKKKKEAELLRKWGDEEDEDEETLAFLGYHNAQCELCATGGKLLCCDGCPRAYHLSCVQPPITKMPNKQEDWFCPQCQEVFGWPKPKTVPSEDNEYCQVCVPFPGVPRSLIESMTDGSSQGESDELEQNSDGGGEEDASAYSSDEMTSEHDGNSSDFPSTDELSSNTGNHGSLTDNESDSTSAKIPSASPAVSSTGPTVNVPAQTQQLKSEGQPSSGSLQAVTTTKPVEKPIESPSAGVRRVSPVQLERPGSGRKRHRKTLAPRRIPPSRFDS